MIGVIWREYHPVFSVPGHTTRALRNRKSCIYAREVISADKPPRLFYCRGRYVVPMNFGGMGIELHSPTNEIRAKRTEIGAVKRELQRCFLLAPFGEQCDKHEGKSRCHRHGELSALHTLHHGNGWIAEVANAKDGRANNEDRQHKCGGDCKCGWIPGGQPKQQREFDTAWTK